ncbi:MAG: nuclear transport factor 2 family protein [Deltaproteobacteria bacterium]|nr:nuclear transport factor 2 family protein [Deltaproteobacteria bacterium]
MEILPQFMKYAADFEKTFVDDDWSRLRLYFAENAVYEVKARSFGCRLQGPDAIFRGIKKSLDGFDRKFSGRDIQVTSGPEVDGNEMRMTWAVTYSKEGIAPFVLRGQSTARYEGDKIVALTDSYDPSIETELEAWQKQNGLKLEASYT